VSSLLVQDGVVYAGAVDVPANQSYIYALSARTGTLLWRHRTADQGPEVAAVVGGVVFAGAGTSVLALRASDGALLWSADTGRLDSPSLILSNGVVYSTGANKSGSALFALSASDGKLLWQRTATAADNGPFSLPTVVGGVVYVYNGPLPVGGGIRYASIYALRSSDGAVLWRQPWQRHLVTIFSAPVVANGVIYTSTDAGTEIPAAAYALRASDGAVLWRGQVDENALDSPVVLDGLVFIPTRDPLDALDASTGQLRWRLEARGPRVEAGADHGLYVSDGDGIAALDAVSGAVRWRYPFAWLAAERAVANGMLYLYVTSTALEAIDAVTGNLIWRAKPDVVSTELQVDSAGMYLGTGVYNNICGQPTGPGYVYALDATTGAVLWRYQMGGQLGG
jgi:outer membrane protein assembly factor BamB